MSSSFLKKIETFPPSIGRFLAHIPFAWRPGLGGLYSRLQYDAVSFYEDSSFSREEYLFKRLKSILEYAEKEIPFYVSYYHDCGFESSTFKSLDDIDRIPIINKRILRNFDLEQRSKVESGRFLANTGGTSGSPFTFYLSGRSNANEWAHMHLIWRKLGYKPDQIYISLVGRTIKNLDKKFVVYDSLRNRFLVNIYADYEKTADVLLKVFQKYKIEYLHGYPGSIYDFALFCFSQLPQCKLDIIKRNLKGCFLGSEFPSPLYRNTIENVFGVPSVSWYGHSERVVLAWEKEEQFIYHPFQTYGYTEAVSQSDGSCHLVGTSYDNTAGPFIRYDTEDFIDPHEYYHGGVILKSFRIKEGRSADFIEDKKGKSISLTALFFGRHHPICGVANHIQIKQTAPGKAIFYVVMDKQFENEEVLKLFNLDGIDVDFSVVTVDKPIRTKVGKIPLKIQ